MTAASYAEGGRPSGTRGGIDIVRANKLELSLDNLLSESIRRTDRVAGGAGCGEAALALAAAVGPWWRWGRWWGREKC